MTGDPFQAARIPGCMVWLRTVGAGSGDQE